MSQESWGLLDSELRVDSAAAAPSALAGLGPRPLRATGLEAALDPFDPHQPHRTPPAGHRLAGRRRGFRCLRGGAHPEPADCRPIRFVCAPVSGAFEAGAEDRDPQSLTLPEDGNDAEGERLRRELANAINSGSVNSALAAHDRVWNRQVAGPAFAATDLISHETEASHG